MKIKQLFLAMVLMASITWSFAQGNFDKSKDLLLANYDIKADEDDIHSATAFASMLKHTDLSGVKFYVVAGAYGTQGCNFVATAVPGLYNTLFGAENTNWTNAHANRAVSVTRVKDKIKATIDAGGRVFIAEAGQSDVTYDALQQVIGAGISAATIKSRVIVVQHSQWNEDNTTQFKLGWVKANTTYNRIADGNTGGNGTPGYNDENSAWLNQANGAGNPNLVSKNLWSQADYICDTWNTPGTNCFTNSVINGGGVDFSDNVEMWWIFNIGANADTVAKFWSRYVTNNTVVVNPPTGTAPIGKAVYLQGNNGRYVCSENGAQSGITCNRTAVGAWERFTVVSASNGKIALKGTNGKFISSENGAQAMRCDRATIGANESFDWIGSGNSVQLRGNDGRFVSSENGNGSMFCNRGTPQGWENFTWAENGTAFRQAAPIASEDDSDFMVFPNPNISRKLTINLPSDVISIELMDYTGRAVRSRAINGENTIEMDLDVPSGVYLIHAVGASSSKFKKLIVE
jgi:hypothetical protein